MINRDNAPKVSIHRPILRVVERIRRPASGPVLSTVDASRTSLGSKEIEMKETIKQQDLGNEFYTPKGCYIVELSNTPDDPDLSIARARVV